jgi:hypothetical protein
MNQLLSFTIAKLPSYIISGLAVALVVSLLPKKKFNLKETVIFAATTVAISIILDLLSPEVYNSFNTGAGFGIGAQHVGFNLEGFDEHKENFQNDDEDEADIDLSQLQKELMSSDDDNDENFDNIENMFREEFEAEKRLNNEDGSDLTEAFQNEMTTAERGLVFGQVIGGTHGTQIQELIYSGDTINLAIVPKAGEENTQTLFLHNDEKRNVVVFQPIADSNNNNKNVKRLTKLRIEGIDEKSKNFKMLNILKYGDILEFKYNFGSADKYIANTDFNVLTGDYDTPSKQRQLFVIENEEDPIGMKGKGISYNDIIRLKYVGSNARKDNFVASKENNNIVTTNNTLENRGTFVIKKCDINCSGPLWRFK